MKRKIAANILIALGIILMCVAVALSVVATNEKDIIGGADFHTFAVVFFQESSGIYFLLAVFGVVSIVASVIICLLNRKNSKEAI